MGIDYDADLVKHYVRTDGWLPACRQRLKSIRRERPRRLRYFTFCATGAVDVLMLNVAKIVLQSATANRFDTVTFFGRDDESIIQTQRRIPGAIGFPGNFVDVVLLEDPDELVLAENVDPLDSPEDERDEANVRHKQRIRSVKRAFIRQFPFDVVNLDLEEFVFKPKEDLPGKMVNALRKVFNWQKKSLAREQGPPTPIAEFTLMFTTQIGPPNITSDYLDMLEQNLTSNLAEDDRLSALLKDRSGTDDPVQLRNQQFELFFKLSMPKIIAAILLEEDWYIEPEAGIKVYQYSRASKDGPYQMLNFVMNVNRQNPPRERRPPASGGSSTTVAIAAYRDVAFKLFRDREKLVIEADLDESTLRESLEKMVLRGI